MKTIFFILIFSILTAQQKEYSLNNIIQIAHSQSISVKKAQFNQTNAESDQNLLKASLKPQMVLSANTPNFYKSSSPITQPDGSIDFLPIDQDNSWMNLNVSKQLVKTNTRLFADFNFNRYQNFDGNSVLYNTVPFKIGIEQGIFSFNSNKWDLKINDLNVKISSKQALISQQQIALDAVPAFFEVLLSQVSKEIAESNLSNNQKIIEIAQKRYELGVLSKDDLLQLELQFNKSKADVLTSNREILQTTSDLKIIINDFDLKDSIINVQIPEKLDSFNIDETKAVALAWQNRPEAIENQRALVQAQKALEEERKTRGFQMQLQGSVGVIGSSGEFSNSFGNTRPDIFVQVGLKLPILDGGQKKIAIQRESNRINYTKEENVFKENSFKENVGQLVRQFNEIQQEFQLSKMNVDLAQQRYEIANQRYLLSHISVTDLSLAFAERDRIWLSHIALLKSYWTLYYAIRALTLYDFKNNKLLYP